MLFQADYQVELLLPLDNLGRCGATDGSLDQAVDIGYVQAVAGNPGTIDVHGQTRLTQLLHKRDVLNPAHALEDALNRLALAFERVQVDPEDFDGESAL